MLDHIKLGADFTTTYLTTFRTGLPGDSSTLRTLYQFFRTKKHVLDAISRKKPYPFAWGSRDHKCKSYQLRHTLLRPFPFFTFVTHSLVKTRQFNLWLICLTACDCRSIWEKFSVTLLLFTAYQYILNWNDTNRIIHQSNFEYYIWS